MEQDIPCKYEPCIHACVNIPFLPEGSKKNIYIFVFESGSILITGAKNEHHITGAYKYINENIYHMLLRTIRN